jgi:hypothetical protein
VTYLLVQAESRNLSAFCSLHMTIILADSERVRGPSRQAPHPASTSPDARKQSASSAPLIILGRYGAVPV